MSGERIPTYPHADMKTLAISTATVIAAFGIPLILATSVDLIGGRVQDEWTLTLGFFEFVVKMAVWGTCAIATVVNRETPATASLLLWSAAAATALCAIATLVGLFVLVGLFTTFAMCLILSLPTLALAMVNAKSVRRRAAG